MQTRGICILVQFCPILTFCNRLLPLFASASSSIRDSSLLLTFVLQYSIFSTEFKAFLIFSCSAALSLCFPLRCESSLNQATLASSSQSPLPPFGAQGTSLLNVCASSHLFANLTPTFFAPSHETPSSLDSSPSYWRLSPYASILRVSLPFCCWFNSFFSQ